ncbi:MAG TPA: hypothetical protein VKW78_04970 [Terriglobales bacterium]|nr:hypothetical protein [Terriglobales bacterium]
MPQSKDPGKVTNIANVRSKSAATSTITVLHVRRWVRWWFYAGVVCGAVALANIFFRNLTRTQEEVILFLGVMFWILGGLVCWAWEGIKLEKPGQPQEAKEEASVAPVTGPKPLTDFMLRGRGQLRPRTSERVRLLTEYLRRWGKQHHLWCHHLPGNGNHPRVM